MTGDSSAVGKTTQWAQGLASLELWWDFQRKSEPSSQWKGESKPFCKFQHRQTRKQAEVQCSFKLLNKSWPQTFRNMDLAGVFSIKAEGGRGKREKSDKMTFYFPWALWVQTLMYTLDGTPGKCRQPSLYWYCPLWNQFLAAILRQAVPSWYW